MPLFPGARVYYFGCADCVRKGHYLYEPSMLTAGHYTRTKLIPWGDSIDATLSPKTEHYQEKGKAALHHKDGWTALAFWDRSCDSRGNSNSVFIAEGTFTFKEMVEIAQHYFRGVWKRFKFKVVEFGLEK